MTLNAIQDLAAAWEKAHPKRAKGGVIAIAGFRYQFHCVLRDAVRVWIDDQTGIAPSMEVLSDVLAEKSDHCTVTQIKRTGTSGSLHKALDELWTIECVAQSEFPQLLPSISYEVRCAKWELMDVSGSIDRWKPSEQADASDSVVEEFKGRISPSCVPHPLDELISMLVDECQALNALEWVDRWTARLVGLSTGDQSPGSFGNDLYESLRQLKDERRPKLPLGVQSVPPNFAEPDSVIRGSHLVGEQPRFVHLIEGCFAPRGWQVEPASQAFLEWLESDPFGSDKERRLPVFWIAGRSGSGKSVLLLQLLARLSQSGVAPVLWLGNRRNHLPEAMKWGVLATERHVQPIIAIDDPFAPGEQGDAESHWQKTMSQVEAVRDRGDSIPVVLACGPTEQAHSFEQELESDIQLRLWSIEEAGDTAHLPELMQWFEQRTGNKAPDVGQGEILMVQRFFEWRTGESLSQFATRFRGRVEALSDTGELTKLVSQLLAVNRLYAGLPEAVMDRLNDFDRDALQPLEHDHHITINAESGRPGMWLAHPHLADALFRGWFRKNDHHQRDGALRNGIVTCLEAGRTPAEQTAPLWALSRAWAGDANDDLAKRVDRERTASILEKVHPRFSDENERLAFSHLPIWIRLSALVADLDLTPMPVEEAIREMRPDRVDETGFRLTCHILLSHLNELGDHRTPTLHAIRKTLDASPEWHQWPFVAADLAKLSCEGEDGSRLIKWISTHRDSRPVPWLLSTAITIPECRAEAQEIAAHLAPTAPGDIAWATLLERLLEQSDVFNERVACWAAKHALSPRSPFVLRGLLLKNHAGAAGLARAWVAEHGRAPVANFLIEPLAHRDDATEFDHRAAEMWVDATRVGADRLIEWLLSNRPTPEIIRLADEWLTRQSRAVGWPFVFEKLIEIVPSNEQREALIGRGLKWLEGREDHNGWGFVFQKLMPSGEPCESLITRGLKWLEGREDHKGWPQVLRKLLKTMPLDEQREALITRGVKWLDGREDDDEWPNVLRTLLKMVPLDEQREALITRGVKWLDGREDDDEWSKVLRKLIEMVPSDEQREALIARGVKWLDGRKDDDEWSKVLRKLIEMVPSDEQREALITRGVKWLDGREDEYDWPNVLRTVHEMVPSDEQREALITRGVKWLDGREDDDEWSKVLRKLIEMVPSDEQREALIARGVKWLDGREDDDEWSKVLRKLIEIAPSHEQRHAIFRCGLKRLDKSEDEKRWAFEFEKLIEIVPSDEQREALITRGQKWLEGREDEKGWNYVFQKLIEMVPSDEQREALITRGQKWLGGREDEQGWSYVLRKLIEMVPSDEQREALITRGVKWLEGREDEQGWSYVLRKLLDVAPSDEQHEALIIHGLKWLEGREGEKEWSQVLQKLIEIVPSNEQREALITRGLSWLEGREGEKEWSHVLQKLIEIVPSNEQREALIMHGLKWLEGGEGKKAWNYVFQKLLEIVSSDEQREALITRGLSWLAGREDEKAWNYVFQKLIDAVANQSQEEQLLNAGLAWAEGRETTQEWRYVWQKVFKIVNRDHVLSSSRDGWASLWVALFDDRENLPNTVTLTEFLELGRNWLLQAENQQRFSWSIVLDRLLKVGHLKDVDLLPGIQGVYANTDHPVAPSLAARMVLVSKTGFNFKQLSRWIRVWLDENPDHHDHSFVYECHDRSLSPETGVASSWQQIADSFREIAEIEAVVTNVSHSNVTVLLDCGLESIVEGTEISWSRYINPPTDAVRLNDRVRVIVTDLDCARRSIKTSIRRANANPWPELANKYTVGTYVEGTVVRLDSQSAFVELEPKVLARLHIDNLSWTRCVKDVGSFCSLGDFIRCVVINVSVEHRSLRVGIKQLTPDPWEREIIATYKPGQVLRGTVTDITNFGLFMEIAPELEGLVHWSEAGIDSANQLEEAFTTGMYVTARVMELRPDTRSIRLSLCNDAGEST